MTDTPCPTCQQLVSWSWEDAFNKFGFDDGGLLEFSHHVAEALREHGYTVKLEPWGIHNAVITSVKSPNRKELIPADFDFVDDDARRCLPKRIVRLLDKAFPPFGEVLL